MREETTKITLSVVLGFAMSLCDKYAAMLGLMCVAIVFDVITGLIKSKCNNIKLSSQKGTTGFFKKLVFIIAYFFGVFLDSFIPYTLTVTGTDLGFKCCFGLIIGAYIILNESISICENLYACNSEIFPQWILTLLKKFKDKINNKKGD